VLDGAKNIHPADETRSQLFLHGYLPLVLAVLVAAVSLYAELNGSNHDLFQRSGSLIVIIGAYTAFIDLYRSHKFIDGHAYFNSELVYRKIAIGLGLSGTIIWGYGDLLLCKIIQAL